MEEVESIFLNGAWLSIGGNTPFQGFKPKGVIKSIKLMEIDPRNYNGADSVVVEILFDDEYVLKVKTSEYMVVYKTEKPTDGNQ